MQVAVRPVRVVERAVHLVVHVVAVRDCGVGARVPVRLPALHGRAGTRPPAVHVEAVLVGVVLVRRVQVPVVEVVRVVAVPDGPVPATFPVAMGVLHVLLTGHVPSSQRAGVRVNRGIIC